MILQGSLRGLSCNEMKCGIYAHCGRLNYRYLGRRVILLVGIDLFPGHSRAWSLLPVDFCVYLINLYPLCR